MWKNNKNLLFILENANLGSKNMFRETYVFKIHISQEINARLKFIAKVQ